MLSLPGNELAALAALNSLYVSRSSCSDLHRRFGSLLTAFESAFAGEAEALNARLAGTLTRELLSFGEREIEEANKAGISLLPFWDPKYPSLLSSIANPPPLLYYRGDLTSLGQKTIAVVGSRTTSHYGRRIAASIGGALAEKGYTVVSGLARGIDSEVHAAALEAGGYTAAVLGTGLLNVYPAENRNLAAAIEKAGILLSEFPLKGTGKKFHFPRRNRVISGLSVATVVVEAGERSGALITATWAAEQGREVFAVPGPVDTGLSAGCHQLLREGARIAESAKDVESDLENLIGMLVPGAVTLPRRKTPALLPVPIRPAEVVELRRKEPPAAVTVPPKPEPLLPAPEPTPARPQQPRPIMQSPIEARRRILLDALTKSGSDLDDIEQNTGLGPEATLPLLLEMELEGQIVRLTGQRFARK
ncbi:MAG: DNA-processing protein DprA [Candidatus Brocadiia bacterium]